MVMRRDAVERATGLPRSTIYELMTKGLFPRPIRLGARSVGWLENEIQSWLKARVVERDRNSRLSI
jgi:prophage regulatory protein